jgi:2-polyprenyl-3-methyl-5-hydroxy-6-metoxy-1,4-benzoquinol methylase
MKNMGIDQFIALLEEEIKVNTELQKYYRFFGNEKLYEFRKAYFQQRLEYIAKTVTDKKTAIWDCGCGYGTTGFFLALNGYKVYGTTIEYYIELIGERQKYWEKHGDISNFTVEYENIFRDSPSTGTYDYIILQDVLHHLEPINDALSILHDSLKQGGKLVCVEENGNNIIQAIKLFVKRGNNRIITVSDHQTGEEILLGNENIRSLGKWNELFRNHNLRIEEQTREYIRVLPPFFFNRKNYQKIISFEQHAWRKASFLKEFFFSGINFTAVRED